MGNHPAALNDKEWQICHLIARGLKNSQVAAEIGLAEGTVKNYVKTIFDKTGMDNRLGLALWFLAKTEGLCTRT